jgi:hypothetical protein
MSKILSLFTLVFMVATLAAADVGTAIAKDARVSDMPAGINYEIQLTGVWPDRYFAEFYDMPAPRSFYMNTYWTFEPSKYPLSPPVWVHHLNELTMKDTDFTVIQVTQ